MTAACDRPGVIEVRLELPAQLLHRLDPKPTHRRRLAPDVAEYILRCADEIPDDVAIHIDIHLPAGEVDAARAADLGVSIQSHFLAEAEIERGRRQELFRSGRQVLAISLIVLLFCLLVSWLLERSDFDPGLSIVVRESLVIIGWVIVWRPAEIFLYDWLPIRQQRKLLDRLSRAHVSVTPCSDREAGFTRASESSR